MKLVRMIVYPLLTLVVGLVVWDLAIRVFRIPNFILPTPATVIQALFSGYVSNRNLWAQFLFTGEEVALGYAIGCTVGVLVGALLAESRFLEVCTYPLIVAFKSTPKVALAPLIMVWFGFGIVSKIVMVALICFFPVFVNTFVGIRQVNVDYLDLMRVFSASRWYTFAHVKLPSALGMIFAGLQIAVVMALIGAIVGEFVASSRGLGYVISSNSTDLHLGPMFAAILSLSVMGVLGNVVVRLFHDRLVFWDRNDREDSVVMGTA